MASELIYTANDGEKEGFNFNQWITQNGLEEGKDLLIKHNMMTPSSLTFTSEEYFKLISDPALHKKIHLLPIITKAMQKNKSSKIKIIVAEEEEKSINSLKTYNHKMNDYKQQLKNLNVSLTQNINKCTKNIDIAFDDLNKQINMKQNQMQQRLKSLETAQKYKINATKQIIINQQTKIQNTIQKCIELQEKQNLDQKRKPKIISMVEDVMKNKLNEKELEIDTNIMFIFNNKEISSFIDGLSQVYLNEQHPIPIIDGITVKSITKTTAIIHFNASLEEKDKERKIKTKLMMKLEPNINEMDEKKDEIMETLQIAFDLNKKQYEFSLTSLMQNKYYMMNLNLYQMENKELKRIIGFKSICITFKTSNYDIDKHYYKSDFDKNGICYALGTDFGTKSWTNPSKQGKISVTCSHNIHSVHYVVGRSDHNNYSSQNVTAGMWICINFGTFKIKPTSYTLKHGDHSKNYILRNWTLSGSNDGKTWTLIKRHENDDSLKTKFDTHSWMIPECNEYFTVFRIYQFDKNSSNTHSLRCCGFEIYGYLIGDK